MKSSLLTLAIIVLIAASAVAMIWTSKIMEGQISRRVATSLETEEAHGGRIWVESALGEGTSVYFTIPQASGQHQVAGKHVA